MLLELHNINFGFTPEKKIFTDLSLSIREGEIYALMGGNGTGKSTLFNLVTGYHQVRSGKIIFKNSDITNSAPYKINRFGIGRTFQDLRLISKLSVRENIFLAMPGHPSDSWIKAFMPSVAFKSAMHNLSIITNKIIDAYFLKDIQHALAAEISFGQQKLLNLACCIANGADLLLLDEPVAGVSPKYREILTLLIRQLKQQGKTILMIEHNTDFIAATADCFLFLEQGEISEFDKFIDLQNSKQAADAYF